MPTKNLVSDFGGVGDGQRQTLNITVASGSPTLTIVGATPFNAGTIAGKTIAVWNGSNYKSGVVQASPSPTSSVVTLDSNFSFSLTNSSSDVLWGTDNTSALTGVSGSWRSYAQTQTNPADIPILQIPDGNYAYFSSSSAGGALHYNVLNSAKVSGLSGVAANCKLMQFGNGEMRFGTNTAIVANRGYNTTQSGGNSVRLATAAAGATTTTVVDYNVTSNDGATWGSRVVVGRACLLAAYDVQAIYESYFGYPPNSFFFEWNVISAYNSGTGAITFQNPLTQAYKSTYPRWGLENTQFGSDQGGPFTMWIAPDGYNNTITLENITIDSPHNQCALHMRNWVGNNLIMSGPGLYPTQNDIVELNNCVYPSSLEVDKMTNQVTWNNCTIRRLQQQSASPNKMIINGGTIDILETAKYTEANNVSFANEATLALGVAAFGRSDRVVLNGCTGIALVKGNNGTTSDLGGSSGAGSQQNASDFYTFDTGVIKFLKTANDSAGGQGQQNLTRLFSPGSWIFFDTKYLDQVDDVYEDGTYCYVRFKNTTNWPYTPVLRLNAHPCPDLTVINCTGTAPELEDFNQAPARAPAFSYSKRTYTDDSNGTTVKTQPLVYGRLTTAKYNVTVAGSVTFNQSRFNNWTTYKTDYSTYTFQPTIGCVNTGLRVINGGSTATGAQGTDSIPNLTTTGQIWIAGTSSSGPIFSANSTGAVISAEIITDQGIPPAIPPAVAPLRLRLRA